MAKFIKSKVNLHDRTQIQTAFDYFLAKDSSKSGKMQRFDLEIYFFFPPQFNIHPHTYSKEDFYQDLHPLLRLKAPAYSYKNFIGTDEVPSVFKSLVDKICNVKNPEQEKQVIEEIRLVGCSFRSYLLKSINRLIKLTNKGDLEDPNFSFQMILETLKKYYQVFSKWTFVVEKVAGQQNINSKLIKEIGLLNEYIVYSLQVSLANLLVAQEKKWINKIGKKLQIIRRVKSLGKILTIYAKQKRINFVNKNSSSSDKESFSMRLSYLKRRVSQVLYLNLQEKKSFFSKSQLAYMLAAAFAASWALLANIFIWYKLGFGGYQSLSESALGVTGFLILLAFIGSYILKDRLKDYGRQRLQRGLLSFLPDHSEKVWYEDHSGQKHTIGKVSEYQDFVKPELLPPEIVHQRHFKLGKKLAEYEDIIHYHKSISLNDRKIKNISSDLSSIKDIIRLNVKRFISHLDDPVKNFCSFDNKGNLIKVELPKVYYFDMIFHYSQKLRSGKILQTAIDSKRILLNKKGVVRII
jgi:hypothetical protein